MLSKLQKTHDDSDSSAELVLDEELDEEYEVPQDALNFLNLFKLAVVSCAFLAIYLYFAYPLLIDEPIYMYS